VQPPPLLATPDLCWSALAYASGVVVKTVSEPVSEGGTGCKQAFVLTRSVGDQPAEVVPSCSGHSL
jgi:hypothetical protein